MLKSQLPKLFGTFFFLLFFCIKAQAVYTFVWKGSTSTAWTTSGNWTRSGSGDGHGYPGQTTTATTDIVQIGTTPYTVRQPTLSSSLKVASIEFGDNSGADMTLTVTGATLTVTGNISQDFIAGYINFIIPVSQNLTTTLAGTGTIICQNFLVGDTTQPTFLTDNLTQVSSQINQLTINGNLILNSEGDNNYIWPFGYFDVNYPEFSVDNNKLSLYGQIVTTSDNNPSSALSSYSGIGLFTADNNANNTTVELLNANPISTPITSGFIIDFTNNGSGTGTVLYDATSGTQTVYTSATSGLGTNTNYDNLTFSSSSSKTLLGNALTIGGTWTTGGGTVNLSTNNPVITVSGDWSNTTTITGGSGNINVSGNGTNSGTINGSSGQINISGNFTNSGNLNQGFGNIEIDGNVVNSGALTLGTGSITMYGNYTNSGTYTQSSGNTVFAGVGQSLITTGSTKFNNVYFNGGGGSASPAKLTSGSFSVSSSGVLTMQNGSYLNANGNLTLNSDATGSATVAAITAGNGITGSVKVQRFVKGSTDLSKRGYRLMSSPIYTGTSGGSNVFDFSYLTSSLYVSGLGNTTNGFNMPNATTNPSLYLFREDVQPPPNNSALFFTTYNWKGVAKINNSPAYNIGMPSKTNTANANNLNYTIPVGNGFLMFFRGDKTASTLTSPFSAPNNVTLTQNGTLNTGTIDVKLWYASDYTALGNNFTFTNWTGSTSTLQGGSILVGNPYASTINWEKYNRNATKSKSSIYGGGTTAVSTTIWVLNAATKQYESYTQKSGTITAADTTTNINPGTTSVLVNPVASNMIASGQGFFVKATAANQTLSFRETAKTNTQPDATKLNVLMGKPKEFVAQPVPSFHLKLVKDSLNTDEIAIRITDSASTKFVVNEDAEDMGGNGALESLSAFSSDNVALSIDFVPYPGKQQEIIPLLVDGTSSGNYKLINNQLANLPALYEMWLKDAFANDSLKMATNATYNFAIDKNNPATFGDKRFSIIIRQNADSVYKLLDFTATKIASPRQVQLIWKTQNEQNYINFTVERSTDGGKTFDVVGGSKATGAGTYSLLDKNPVTGQNLYRLKQEDADDSITYSKTVLVQYTDGNNTADKVRVYPNPAVNTINVAIAAEVTIKPPYTIQISNSSGFLIKQVTTADANWQSSIAGLLPGTYIVKVHNSTDNSLVGDTKFVKL